MKLGTLSLVYGFLPQVYCWGTLGHTTVAYIASNFVSSETKDFFQTLLRNDTDSYLANIATWADSFRYTAAGRFSAPFHFIDAFDDPPLSCGVQFVRDCGEMGCIVGAIQNYTSQLLNPNLDFWDRNMAAKFIIHFAGDIHQPLHNEDLSIGGNAIAVNFSGVATNLHHVWDSSIPEKLVGGYTLSDASRWAQNLTTAIQTGVYKLQAKEWLKGMNLGDPLTTSLGWAGEANAFVCTAVLPEGVEGLRGRDLSGDYYEEAVPVIQLLVAKAGYRLAAWLDLITEALKALEPVVPEL